jgi:hypothetical protein
VEALYEIYATALPSWKNESEPGIFFMLWDHINSHAARSISDRPDSVESEILDAIFETLARVLRLPDLESQGCALHGLGHLPHNGVRSLVQAYIDNHQSDLRPDEIAWLEQCRDGTVM